VSVLIVGGAGYIGSQTAKAVAAAGLEAIVFDNLVYGHEWAVKWGPLVRGDLADRALLGDVMKRHSVTAVVHFAAYAYVGESVTNPRKYFRNNVAGTLNLLDAMLDAGVRDDRVLVDVRDLRRAAAGADLRGPSAESGQPVRRDQARGREDAALVPAAYGLRYAALRYFNAAGADPDGEIGEDHDPETHLIPLAIDAAMRRPRSSRSSAPTTRRPTARRSATTSTSRIWPTRTSRRWTGCATAPRA
jgi:NAD(P)-dependent dehydrogenase (short-subunit alcohol dehydrogenase family)